MIQFFIMNRNNLINFLYCISNMNYDHTKPYTEEVDKVKCSIFEIKKHNLILINTLNIFNYIINGNLSIIL